MLRPHRRGSLRGRPIQEPASSPDLDTESIDSSSRPTALLRDHAASERRPSPQPPFSFLTSLPPLLILSAARGMTFINLSCQ